MRSPRARAAVVIAALVTVVVLFVVLGGSDDEGGSATGGSSAQTAPTQGPAPDERKPRPPRVKSIVVRNAKPVGGVERLSFQSGDIIRFRVTSDTADEIHVHGYDESKAVRAGGSVRFSFPASIEGVFEVELEELGEPIAELRVNP